MSSHEQRWPRGRCEYWISDRALCPKDGRWLVAGRILCGEHRRLLRPVFPALRHELEVIAGDELAGVLERWARWSTEDRAQLERYLRAELEGYGMLSVAKGREAGQRMTAIRREARAILDGAGCPFCAPDERCALHQPDC